MGAKRQLPSRRIYEEVGRLVRGFRSKCRLTQEDLAEQIGLARTSVANIEQGRQRIALDTLFAIAQALKVNARDLLPAESNVAEAEIEQNLGAELDEQQRRVLRRLVS